ncbi:hypothetical protein M1446_04785 [Candidatus Dependentiae bacterium]|nr:hypothetical protein [Candidatus Dependentiae bacterium]
MKLNFKPSFKNFFILFLITFLLRAFTFYFYIQHEERYHQADSMDYHNGALCISLGHGMSLPTQYGYQPIFWRTPGYPTYLSMFYKFFGITNTDFSANSSAQKASIWIQIFLCSFLPILIFYLALILTSSLQIAWLAAWISSFHIGYILASTYLLTDALGALIFTAFLIFFYSAFSIEGEIKKRKINFLYLIFAALFLGTYTWVRPMGQTIALVSTVMILFAHATWPKKFASSFLFFIIFFATLFPWCVRNYCWTGKFFYWPVIGTYLTCFSAPKIHSKVYNLPLQESHKIVTQLGGQYTWQEMVKLKQENSPYVVCPQLACLPAAMSIIKVHPFIFLKDWITEVFKTTFDLYSSQLVALAKNCYKFDPMIEYLSEKFAECLYKEKIPIWARLISWIEFIFYIFVWLGIFLGIFYFLILPIFNHHVRKSALINSAILFLKTGFIIGATIAPTGGFGYARLRLPIESLIIILALYFWFWIFYYAKKRNI